LISFYQFYSFLGGVRPFGVSLLIAGYDENGAHLYQLDPSGAYYGKYITKTLIFFSI